MGERIDTLNEDDRGWLRELVVVNEWDAMKAYGYIRPLHRRDPRRRGGGGGTMTGTHQVKVNRLAKDLNEYLVIGATRVCGVVFAHRHGNTLMSTRVIAVAGGTPIDVRCTPGGYWSAQGAKAWETAMAICGGGA